MTPPPHGDYPTEPFPWWWPRPEVEHTHHHSDRKDMSRVVVVTRKRTSVRLHLTLTILTAGAWGFLVWLPLLAWRRFWRRKSVITYNAGGWV